MLEINRLEIQVQIHTQIRTMSKQDLIEKGLFAYTFDHFESLKDILKKCIQYTYNNFEYNENVNSEFNSFSVTFEKEDWVFLLLSEQWGF